MIVNSRQANRHLNLDLLRVLSMLLIILLHSIDHSGVLEAGSNLFFIRFEYMLVQVCVNCYVMLSGYFLVTSSFRISKLVQLWMETVFYAFTFKVIFMAAGAAPFSVLSLISCLFPFLTGRYWFVTIYVGMYLLSPFLNTAIWAMDKRKHAMLNILLCILFSAWNSIWPTIAGMNSGGGWGLAWFVVLYFAAAWLRLYYKPARKQPWQLLVWIGIAAAVAGMYCIGTDISTVMQTFIGNWYKYNSLPSYMMTLAVFTGFMSISIKESRLSGIIAVLAASTFGVYLIHAHANVSPWIWETLNLPKMMESPGFALKQIGIVLGIFLVCTGIDLLRKKTIGRLEHADAIERLDGIEALRKEEQ